MWKEIFKPTLLYIGIALALAIVIAIIIKVTNLKSMFMKEMASGIVTNVEMEISDGNFWDSKKIYTIVEFKDGKTIFFKSHISKIHLNKCNKFIINTWNNQVHAHLCNE